MLCGATLGQTDSMQVLLRDLASFSGLRDRNELDFPPVKIACKVRTSVHQEHRPATLDSPPLCVH